MTVSKILRAGFQLPDMASPVEYLMQTTPCAICHRVVTEAYPINDLISSSTANIADTFRASHWICVDCAACFADSRAIVGSIFATQEVGLRPLVSDTDGREQWRELVKADDFIGQDCVAIMTSNTKRRLWPAAVVSRLGTGWQPLFVDGNTERLLHISVFDLRECLTLVEALYTLGFSKISLAFPLLHPSNMKMQTELGLSILMDYERQLQAWRGSDEFLLSLFIAQKQEIPA